MPNLFILIVLSIISIALLVCVPRHKRRQRKARQSIRFLLAVFDAEAGWDNPAKTLEEIVAVARKYSIDLSRDYPEHPRWSTITKLASGAFERYCTFFEVQIRSERFNEAINARKFAELEAKLADEKNRYDMFNRRLDSYQHHTPLELIESVKTLKLNRAEV